MHHPNWTNEPVARFIPSINLAEISNSSERKVADALSAHLSDHVNIMHSFNWVQKQQARPLSEGECDFIIIDPKNGLLFIEVKGGILGFDPQTEEWWRLSSRETKMPLNKDPFKQVQNNMYTIVDLIRQNLDIDTPNFTYGYAVVFPDGVFQGQIPPGITRTQILDAVDLGRLDKRLGSVFKLFQRKSAKQLTREEIRKIESALFPKFDIVPVLWRVVEEQEQRLHRLTEEQKSVLSMLENHTSASIQGGAGTGKTLLALAKAQQAAQAGMRTLLLCYNRPLRDWLHKTAESDFDNELTIKTYHELVHDYCKAADLEFNPDRSENQYFFWNDEAPDLLMHACDLLPDEAKFDAIVVDEGQDFQELWWHSLDSVFRNPDSKGCFYVFFDPQQNLYLKGELRLPPELGEPYLLKKNCRNSPEIAEYCEKLINDHLASFTHSVEVSQVDSRKAGFQKIAKLVNEMSAAKSGGLKPSQIVVLVPGYPNDDWPEKFNKMATTRNLERWRRDEGVLIESYARFKGLEADAVIILTSPLEDSDGRDRRLNYVACSRAKHVLKIIEVVNGK